MLIAAMAFFFVLSSRESDKSSSKIMDEFKDIDRSLSVSRDSLGEKAGLGAFRSDSIKR